MTIQEARKAVANKTIIQFINEPNLWGTPTCLSDSEETIYFKPRGYNLLWLAASIDEMEIGK